MATKKQLADAKKLLAQAEARQKDLNAQLAKVNQIAATADPRIALGKLQSGQSLTNAEKQQLNLPITQTPTTTDTTDDSTVTNWRGTITAEKDSKLGALIEQQNAARAARDAAFAAKPTTDPGVGYVWRWQERNQQWAKIFVGTPGGSSGGGGGAGGGGGSNGGTTDVTLVSTETDEYGNVVGIYSDGSTKILVPSGRQYKSTVDLDAYALLEETFKAYGLETLVPKIKTYMERGLGSNQAALQLKTEPEYVERFRGNEIRRAAGLNVLSEGEYLALEDAYSQTLRAYGLQNYFGIDRKAKTASMADIIGNDIDATEFKDRIDTVVTRVQNADPAIKRTLVSFYNINDTDLIKYFLDPKANLPKLQEKVTAAEIGSAALGQGLATNVSDATALALFGITRAQALEGYAKIGETLPTAKKLSGIYAEEEIDYTQTTAEEEVFKGLASAERKRRQLAAREVASFGGASGVSKSAFGSATGGAF